MNHLILIGFACFMLRCNHKKQGNPPPHEDTVAAAINPVPSPKSENSDIPNFTTSSAHKPEAKDLQTQRNSISKHFIDKFDMAGTLYDSLVDINYDGYRDNLIGHYGKSGSGLKYGIAVYLYNPKKKKFEFNENLSEMSNPSFFIDKKKITEFYIGLGGGSGTELNWINKKWTVTKKFEVDNKNDSTIWIITYPLTGKVEKIKRSFQMIPPEEILEVNEYISNY